MIINKFFYESFHENGYLIIEDFFTKNHMEDFSSQLASLIKIYLTKAGIDYSILKNESIFDRGLELLEEFDHNFVAQIYDTIPQMPSFFRICGNEDTEQVINFLMKRKKDSPLYGFTNRCRIDSPKDDRRLYGWHQEVFYTIPKSNFIQTWAPLVRNTTIENGTIQICVGSHKEGIPKQEWTEKKEKATQIIVDKDIVSKHEQLSIEMKLGSILLFSGKTIHRSGNNQSNQVRFSLVGMYHDCSSEGIAAPSISFNHRTQTQKEYYDNTFSK